VNPQFHKVLSFLNSLRLGGENTLEHVSQVTHVELVVEVSGGLSELHSHLVVELQGLLDDRSNLLTHGALELLEMLGHESTVDRVQGVAFREVNGQKPEPTLEARVDDERSSSSVHGGDVLSVGDLLHDELLLIVPMAVIEMLSNESDSSLGFIRVKLGHVQVIDKVDQFYFTRRSESSTTFLLELRLKHSLEQSRVGEEIKVNCLRFIVLRGSSELVEETIDNLSLTTSSISYKHRCDSNGDKVLHYVLRSNGISSRNSVVGDGSASIDTVLNDVSAEVVPVNELGVLSIYVVIEDCSLGREFDSLELLTPELIES
jgi:hypothetical protein